MKEQVPTTIKKNLLLDWIYAQKNNIPVTDLAEFINQIQKTQKPPQPIKKSKTNEPLPI